MKIRSRHIELVKTIVGDFDEGLLLFVLLLKNSYFSIMFCGFYSTSRGGIILHL